MVSSFQQQEIRENKKQGRGRSLFDKTFNNENKEKQFYQIIAKPLS